ncbi:protein phosphatase 2C domain-containing protein [Kitasatospora sp. NBC_00240]|uniref:protein phosphatase 2C domain-containing protein n=1 Tax=Kitasatospora sp. NBC_00240 TaxID=2903567 RepID=UPI0022597E49|nr:protein phosphatase 2C domain-containing protein [Kitasatospora sp. NBC_00240]MCX5212350.1 protein phosphatase 2C domain-containing protein [Kitasatospora sp. NBC_00240]
MTTEYSAPYESVYAPSEPAVPVPPPAEPVSLFKPARAVPSAAGWADSELNPGPAPHIGRKAPAYPPEPAGLPSASAPDLYASLLPDTVLDGGTFGRVVVRAASVRGDSHRYAGECRQDALLVAEVGELALLLVADGVGSQPHSQRGSNGIGRLLAKQIRNKASALSGYLARGDETNFAGLVNNAVTEAAAELKQEAERQGLPAEAYSTTMRALLVPLDPDVRVRGFVSVGDGGLLRLREGVWTPLDRTTDAQPVIDSATDCLPGPYQHAHARLISDGRPADVLVLCTDGFSLPLAGEAEMRELLAGQWGGRPVPGLAEFLWQTQVRARSYDDDRTVICLWEGH